MDSWKCSSKILSVLILILCKSLNLGLTHKTSGDETESVSVDSPTASSETIELNREPRSAKNIVQSSQTSSDHNPRNIHDNRLVFSRNVYSFEIQEDAAPGTVVDSITASNRGTSNVIYAIHEDDGDGLFVINSATGNVTLTRPLDFESEKYYILTVKASDGDGQFSVVRTYLNVLDINDNPPVFGLESYHVNIMENVPVGTRVLNLNVTDADEGSNAALTFRIISGDPSGQFGVDSNAVLWVQKPLDLEEQPVYTLIIQTTDQARCSSTRFTSTAQVIVSLEDVNDNAPQFISATTVFLPEDTPVNTVIVSVKAADLDRELNGHVTYSLQQFTENKFSLDVSSGQLSVIGNLDRELTERFTLRLTASDKGNPPLSSSMNITIIVTDINDNSPAFTHHTYNITVDENMPQGADLLQVTATDPDKGINGQIRYSVASEDFYIDSITGLISVAGNLDRERNPLCSFMAIALDHGSHPRSGTATVNVILGDVNDFVPTIQPVKMTLHILENTNTVPQSIYQVSGRDEDLGSNSQLSYAINYGNEDGMFSLSEDGQLSVIHSLDRESRPEYTLVVTATDAGVPPLTGTGIITIVVDDLNDNSPLFDLSVDPVTISENVPIGTKVVTINAVDPDTGENGQISYSMDGGGSSFSINMTIGEIITASTLDREMQANYTLTIIATDRNSTQPRSSSTSVSVIIGDVNDEPPKFLNDPYVANVPATLYVDGVEAAIQQVSHIILLDKARGYFVKRFEMPRRHEKHYIKCKDYCYIKCSTVYTVTAQDADTGLNGDLRFTLSGTNAKKFTIDSVRGVIFAARVMKGPLDISVDVNVMDQGKDPQMDRTTVTVRFQSTADFPEIFVDNKVYVYPEDQVPNTVVTKVIASSSKTGETGPISFFLAAGNIGDGFQIDQRTGELMIKKTLDFEMIQYYNLWIEARDSGSPPFSSYARIDVNVTDVNDNCPTFQQSGYRCEIHENVPASRVCDVSAVDKDSALNGKIEYSIIDGNLNNAFFMIGSFTGIIRTTQSLDRERWASYTLTVQAKDNGIKPKTGTAVVIISVLDTNDNAPRFPQIFLAHVPENAPIGFIIVRLTITDEDIGVNAISTYSISDETTRLPFAINQNTGDLTVAKLLDRETTDQYIIRVHANDSAWSVNTDVTLLVTDANDNEPKFTVSFYTVTIPEPKDKETFVLQVSATDPDLNQNGQVFYLLKSPNEFFGINATTGEIFTKQFISFKNSDHTNTNKINLSIIASDRGEPSNQAETIVMVAIVSRNDYPPMFLSHRNVTPVPVNLTFGTKVVKLTATDKDLHSDGTVEYYITGGNSSFLFDIEQESGWVFVNNSLESSLNELFTITVTATDKGMPPLSSHANANFLITEENRFAPKFITSEVTFSIPEDQAPGFVLGTLTASDTDQGVNGLIKYSITSGNDKGYFTIGNTTGLLSLVESLDFEMDAFHILQIYGQDAGWISKTGSLNVLVQIEDVNDNPPRFCNTIFYGTVAENLPCGTEVLQLNATDVDTGINAEINFAIDDAHVGMFAVDPQSGIITVQEILDFELLQFYEITVRAFNLHDTDHFSLAKVCINVTGENEYRPQFSQAHYNLAISEIAPKGTIVGYVTATDRDLGCDGIVNYLLVGDSKKRGFRIDGDTGAIVVSGNSKLSGGSFTLLHVLAKNAGSICGFDVDEAVINITLLDENNPPMFKSSIYQTHVGEDVLVGTSVITLIAEDSDTVPEWNQLLIEIEDGNTNQSFSINPDSGVVFVASPLDRETLPVYNMTIIAFDGGQTPATGSTQLMVIVDDVNDNSPILVTTKGCVSENQPPGREILTLNATDLDLPPNQGPFTYRLAHEHSRNFVTLSPLGVLSTKKWIDRELITDLYLPVIVQDSGTPPMSSMGTVHILVLDQNDNPSQPRNLHIQVNYYGTYFPGGKLGSVKPNDPDVSDVFTCSIENESTSTFTISESCELLSDQQLEEADFRITVEANDNVHSNVSNSVHITYSKFSNSTIANSILLLLATPLFTEFLSKRYMPFVKTINKLLSKGNMEVHLFGMMPMVNNTLLMGAIKGSNGQYISRRAVTEFFIAHKELLTTRSGVTISAINYDPCTTDACYHGAVCRKQISFSSDTAVLESPSVIFLTQVLIEPFTCSCSFGYAGQQCELLIDYCESAPCSNGGTCLNYPGGFTCTCTEFHSGLLCTADVDECQHILCQNGAACLNLPGDFLCTCPVGHTGKLCENTINHCLVSPCLNHGTCINLPTGYSCKCPFGTSGNECEMNSWGFEELSYAEFPPLDPTNNIIYMEFATVKENSLLLYNYDAKETKGGEFLALEILNGQVEFSYNLGNGTVRLITDQRVADGQFHTIIATRAGKVGSLTVDNCTSNQPAHFCFVSTPGIGTERNLDLDKNNMVLGGITSIDPILLRPDQVKTDDFIGCIREAKLNSAPLEFAEALSSYNILTSCPRLDRVCQDKPCLNNGVCQDRWSFYLCQCPDGFIGPLCEQDISQDTALSLNGQAHLDYFIKESSKRRQLLKTHTKGKRKGKEDSCVELQFRTRSSKGVLLHTEGNASYASIMIINGSITYISETGLSGRVEHFIPDVLVSDGRWHTFKVESYNLVTQLILDKNYLHNITHPTHQFGVVGSFMVSLGAGPQKTPGFEGCIKLFKYNDQVMPFTGSNDFVKVQPSVIAVQVGCRGPDVCLSNPCPAQTKCTDLWLTYQCLPLSCLSDPCKNGGTCFSSKDDVHYCVCTSNFTGTFCETCTSDNLSVCPEEDTQYPLSSTIVTIPSVLVLILLVAVLLKSRCLTCKNKQLKRIASQQKGTENRAFDDVDDIYDNDRKQPDILKAEKQNPFQDETFIKGTDMVQEYEGYDYQHHELEFYDIDNASSIAASDADVIQHYRQYQVSSDRHTKLILARSTAANFHPFLTTVNQGNIQSPVQIAASQQSHRSDKQMPKSTLGKQQCPHTMASQWFPSRFTTEGSQHLTDFDGEHSHHILIDMNQSSQGGNDNLAFHEDAQSGHSINSATFVSSIKPANRVQQILKTNRFPLGLSVEEVEKLNAPKMQKAVKNVAQGISLVLPPQRTPALQVPPDFPLCTESSSDSESHSSFTCSEYEYERELSTYNHPSVHEHVQQDSEGNGIKDKKGLNEREITLHEHKKEYTSHLCVIDLEMIAHEDTDKSIPPCHHSSETGIFSWDDLLTWGPNFETYIEIFNELARLPNNPGTEKQCFPDGRSDQEEFL